MVSDYSQLTINHSQHFLTYRIRHSISNYRQKDIEINQDAPIGTFEEIIS